MAEEAAVRANLYRIAAAFFLKPPTREFLDALAGNPLSPAPSDPGWVLEDLEQEFHDLFLVPVPGYVHPYESCYRGMSESGPGMLMGEPARKVAALYSRCGLEPAPDTQELPDHAGLEFSFLCHTAEREARAWEEGDEEAAQAWRRFHDRFLDEHLRGWIPELCSAIQARATQPYYREFARWIADLVRNGAPEEDEPGPAEAAGNGGDGIRFRACGGGGSV